ncbi:MAG: phenylalanine--tRNA ligase subunit beta [Chloroflexota bacterium]
MKIPLSWLKDFVDIDMPAEELAHIMTMAGLEVEHITYIGHPEADLPWDREKLVLGHILKVEQHPDADRLVLATVDIGQAEPETVVTGAPNLYPYVGQGDLTDAGLKSPFVMEGATVYDGHAKEPGKKMKLKARKIRGIMNRHMLCSEKELGISEEHEGIIIMPSDVAPGTPFLDVLGDVIIEFDVLPNIARTASILGVAREIAALTGQPLRHPDYSIDVSGASDDEWLKIETTDTELNPRFVAIRIDGIEIKPSPYWMQLRLRLAGMRPISNIVDISNYVMLEMGQPNHAFDWDILRDRANDYAPDGPVNIITRMAEAGEKIETLDGENRGMPQTAIMVTDPKSALSIGGIMGGMSSEVHDDSKNILLEAAAWNFINIRRTATALKLSSEAGYRFSRGVHPSQAMLGALRGANLMQKLAGGTVVQDVFDYYPNPPQAIQLRLTVTEVQRLLGIDLDLDTVKVYLERLEFLCEVDGDDALQVTVPEHRLDISDDPVIGQADLIEEVARIYGFDKIPETAPSDLLPPQRNNTALDHEERLRDLLVDAGLQEVITYRLTTTEAETRLLTKDIRPDDMPYVALLNPTTTDREVLRHSLVNSVMEIVAHNARYREQIQVFEVGPVFLADEGGVLPFEPTRLVVAMTGPRGNLSWLETDTENRDFFDLKGVIDTTLSGLHIDNVAYEATQRPGYYPGRVAKLSVDDDFIGVLGELHPDVVAAYELPEDVPVLVADLDWDLLQEKINERFRITPISRFPPIQQDIALILDEAVKASDVEAMIRQTGGFLLADVELFDVYRGNPLPADKKSLAYRMTFQAPDKTLNDKIVGQQQKRIVQRLEKQFGATLRS